MALIFCDGFDHYTDLTQKGYITPGFWSITTSDPRTGNGCLHVYTTATAPRTLVKNLGVNNQILVLGCAWRTSRLESSFDFNFSDSNNLHIKVKITIDYKIEIYRDSILLGTSDLPIGGLNEWFYIEIKAYIHDTNGYVIVKKNGEVFYELTGINTYNDSGNLYINTIGFCVNFRYMTIDIDDFYVDNSDFLGDIKVETLYPSGAGTTTQWDALSGSNYENVDEASQDGDTSYVSTATANEIDTYAFGNLTTTAGTVYGVQVNMMARKDDAGSRSIAPVVRPSSVDNVGDTVSLGDSYGIYTQMYNLNPDDNEAWEIADVNGAEFGIKCIS